VKMVQSWLLIWSSRSATPLRPETRLEPRWQCYII